jgi:ABC-2 family transporter protein
MSAARSIYAVARADFFERLRRYSFLVTLLFAVYLGYSTAKGNISLQLDEYRGVYTSAWIGTLVALVTACFVSFVGFYIVKGSVERDRSTGVGQILAATPLSKPAYTVGKFLSNLAVLTAMLAVLALAALAMQFLYAEDPRIDLWALLAPFLLLALPSMALTAAFALFFEIVPVLRGGIGNVAWFFVWNFGIAFPFLSGFRWFDPIGLFTVMQSLSAEARRYIPGYHGGMAFQINTGQIHVAQNLRWPGIHWTWDVTLHRLLWFAVAAVLSLLAALLFDRFDSDRSVFPARAPRTPSPDSPSNGSRVSSATPDFSPTRAAAIVHLTPLARATVSSNFLQIYSAELTLALKGARWWWWSVAAGLSIAQFAAPLDIARGPLLAVAWLWPALFWSAMGARETRYGTRQLLFSCARILPRQLPACWLAGVTIALLTGLGAGSRLALAGRLSELFAFVAALFFIPSLALFLGILTGAGKFFEAFYTLLWYLGPMNHTPGLEFTGAASASHTVRYAAIYLALSFLLLLFAFTTRAKQLRGA